MNPDHLYVPAVVALAGARDNFQLPLALHQHGDLEAMVTDFYWPLDAFGIGPAFRSVLPSALAKARYCQGLSSRKVIVDLGAFALAAWMHLDRRIDQNNEKDRLLGKKAREVALRTNAALFCYSYYAASAFMPHPEHLKHRFIFQVHPHPHAVRKLLAEEIELVPASRASIQREHEIRLPTSAFEALASEPHLANGWAVASGFSASTLVSSGIPAAGIHIIPYGVNSDIYQPRSYQPSPGARFTVVFVGTLIQRKGVSYLLDAIRLLHTDQVRVLLCGRGFADEQLLAQYDDLPIEVHRGLSTPDLVRTLHECDVMVFPSLAEGFGHVILEAMSSGVPVITTPNTCGPDVITEGVHGFIVPIRDPAAIAEKLAWGIENRQALAEMGRAAAAQARLFTWERFRAGIRQAYRAMLASPTEPFR